MKAIEGTIILTLGSYRLYKIDKFCTDRDLASLMDNKMGTISRHLNSLKDQGLIVETKARGEKILSLTKEGSSKHDELFSELMEAELIPQGTGSKVYKFKAIYPYLKDQDVFIRIITQVRRQRSVDVLEVIRMVSALRPDSLERKIMGEKFDISLRAGQVDEIYRDQSILGRDPDSSRYPISREKVEDLLIVADIKRRLGKVEDARRSYESILETSSGLDVGSWIVATMGLIRCIRNNEGQIPALRRIDGYLNKTTNAGHVALLSFIKADTLSDMGDNDEALLWYRTSHRMMRALDMHYAETEMLNSLGVHYFRIGERASAERTWNKALSKARKYDIEWIRGLIEMNLADCWSLKGNHRTAWNKIKRAEEILTKIGDLEGLADVNYNKVLLSIRQGKVDRAHEYFLQAEDFPLAYASKKEEWLKVVNECLSENGYPIFTRAYINAPLLKSEKSNINI